MKSNIGKLDSKIRLVVGFLLIVLGMQFMPIIGLLGVVIVLTSFFKFCPLYLIFKINTCKQDKKSSCNDSDCSCGS